MPVPYSQELAYRSKISKIPQGAWEDDSKLTDAQRKHILVITDTVAKEAAKRAFNAGMDGAYHDGGASESIAKLNHFIDGVTFALIGHTYSYGHIIKNAEQEADPEWQELLRLQKKFGVK